VTTNQYSRENYSGKYKLLAGAIMGARTFKVTADGWLTGVTRRQIWTNTENIGYCLTGEDTSIVFEPDRVLEQTTRLHTPHTLDACACGFYAFFDGSNDFHSDGPVWGAVEGYGEAVLGERGFRARKMKIHALVLNVTPEGKIQSWPYRMEEGLADVVRLRYWNIPLYDTFEEMIRDFPPGGPSPDQLEEYIDPVEP
jgi:hypothetical protein